jgi:SAM-dependent methyltransferase
MNRDILQVRRFAGSGFGVRGLVQVQRLFRSSTQNVLAFFTMAQPLSFVQSAKYDLIALATYAPRPLVRRLLGRSYHRTPEAVKKEYTTVRADYLARFRAKPPPLDDYLLFEAEVGPNDQWVHLLNGRLVYGSTREASEHGQTQIIAAIAAYHPTSVLEVGCGAGHNLLAIKRALPKARCVGLELTRPSVELARAASAQYGLPIEVYEGDATQSWPAEIGDAIDVCFSVHALEQIPDARGVFDRMYSTARQAVVLFEPLVECWPMTPRLLAARIRARHLDRLHGLYPYLQRQSYHLSSPELMPQGHPLNPGVILHVTK